MKAIAIAVLLAVARASAHHAFASEYDVNRQVTVSGTVTRFEWMNPHAWMYIETKDEAGKVATWGFEMGSPNGLRDRGWTPQTVKPGESVTIDGYGSKDGSNTANARMVTLPGGRKLFGGFHTTPGSHVK